MYIESCVNKERERDRQSDRQADRQKRRKGGREEERKREREKGRKREREPRSPISVHYAQLLITPPFAAPLTAL